MYFRLSLSIFFLFSGCDMKGPPQGQGSILKEPDEIVIQPINSVPNGQSVIAIKNVNLIDGTGSDPLSDAVVIIEKDLIRAVGTSETVTIPSGAEVISGEGLSLLPGFIDAHFHLNNDQLPNRVLQRGTTSLRDPGAWIESYQGVLESSLPAPKLFLTGPHLDMPPPAYPKNSYLIRDVIEARDAVNKFADQGASAIKVYFRLPVAIIKAVCNTADQRGIPVTAHLEITSAMQAIEAGVDGIEHITSFGTDLLPTFEAEQYKQSIIADNHARRDGRYQVWNAIDLSNQRVDSLLRFLKQKGTVVSPTLGAFEYQFGSDKTDSTKVNAFKNMKDFVGMVQQAGIPVVVGSHSWVPYQREVGWAFQREMELLQASGLTNMQVIQAATLENARFLKIEDRLGTIEEGKQADLLLLEGDPIKDLGAIYNIHRVMLNGQWID
jgi:imidazolonepropionase-like amidohydrolase